MALDSSKKQALRRLVTPPFVVLAALIIWLEEWLWDYLKILTQKFSRIRLVRRYEHWLAAIPPYPTMVVFFLPGLTLLPIKIFALWLLTSGHKGMGLALIITAKFLGTAIAARSFYICKPKLMAIHWFAALYTGIMRLRLFVFTRIAAMPLYQKTRRALMQMQKQIRVFWNSHRESNLFVQRWKAVRRQNKKKPPSQ